MNSYTRFSMWAIALSLTALSAAAQCGGGYFGGGGDGCAYQGVYCPPECWSCGMMGPIVIHLSEGAWQLSGLNDPVQFDMLATGHKQTLGWTGRDANIAFLALDRNGNGVIDDGSELFGNGMSLPDGQRAPNGFVALAQHDENHDGGIDKSDPIWNSLLLWLDRNHDGISQSNELMPISASPITAIGLFHRWTGRHDLLGNAFRYEGLVRIGNHVQSFYDLFFVSLPSP